MATGGAFAAMLNDGRVVAWGAADRGGDASEVDAEEVLQLTASRSGFCAVCADGRLVTWGDAGDWPA